MTDALGIVALGLGLLFLSVLFICLTIDENKRKERKQKEQQFEKLRIDARIEGLSELQARRAMQEHINTFHTDNINKN